MPSPKNTLSLALDGNEANCAHRVGSNVYAFEILQALEKLTRRQKKYQFTVLLASQPIADLPEPRPGWHYRVIGPRHLWTQLGLPLHLFLHQPDYDLFFTPGHYAPRLCPVPYVSSVMDLAFFRYPDLFRPRDLYQLENWTRYSVAHALKVIAISQFTGREIAKYYHRSAADIVIAYPALADKIIAPNRAQQRQLLAELNINAPYFLYLGTLQPRKNILRLLDAFAQLKTAPQFTDTHLVLAGKNGWLTDEIDQALAASPVRDDIILTGFVTDLQKAALLQNAIATLNLGFYEGFGIPALESLAYGTMPIVAGNTSLPEAVGHAGLSVNPFRTDSIVKAMNRAANLTPTDRQRLARLARRQVSKFSYQRSAQIILDTLVELATN